MQISAEHGGVIEVSVECEVVQGDGTGHFYVDGPTRTAACQRVARTAGTTFTIRGFRVVRRAGGEEEEE